MEYQMSLFTDTQIGLALKAARVAAGWSAKQLAEHCGVLPTALSKIESGKQSLGFAEAIAMCGELGIRVDHLAALARDVEPLASEAASIRDRLKADLRILEQRTIKRAIAAKASESRKAIV
jgi:transcriptional regulator with XRE-family HTH domain